MGRITIVLSVMLLLTLAGPQQVEAQVKSGIRLGLNYPDLPAVIAPPENTGFHIGPYLKLSLAGIVAVESGFQYSQRKFDVLSDVSTTKVTLKYLDVPLMLRMSVLPFVNVFGGPQASVLIGERYSGQGVLDTKGKLPNQELGGVAGIGVKLPFGFNIQGSYDFGLSDLEFNGRVIKNRIFKVSLGKDF